MADRVGQQLGNYRLIRFLGEGGFAEVYLGEHIHLGTEAAIKVLHTQLTSDDLEKFRIEARTIARLKHRHIVRVLDFGVEGKTPFLVLDYAPNGTLRQRHSRGTPLPLTTIVPYVKQVAAALQYAHDQKLVHRDIKPENMLLESGDEILLSDFGIAIVAQSSRYQGTQDLAGTIAYMAPEQIQAHPRPASDQYSLAVVVYEWLSGGRPFHGSFTEIAVKHTIVPPPSLREKVPTVLPDVEQVVMTALAKDPKDRFASVQAFANAFEQACQSEMATFISPLPKTPPVLPSTPLNIPLSAPVRPNMDVPRTPPPPAKVSPPLGTTLYTYRGHSGHVKAVAWSPDGQSIASADTTLVQVWNALPPTTGSKVNTYRGHMASVNAVAWSSDGKYIASGSDDKIVEVWYALSAANTNRSVKVYRGHSHWVNAVVWSPDGQRIASASADQTVQVWDVATGRTLLTFAGHTGRVWAVAWSPNGRHMASASSDHTVQVWDVTYGHKILTYRGHADTVNTVAWSPDGTRIVSGSADQTVQVWDIVQASSVAAAGRKVRTYRGHHSWVWAVAWSPDGKYIASAGEDGTVRLRTVLTGEEVFVYHGHRQLVMTVAWSPDGRLIASGSRDKTVQVWQAT